MTSLNISLLPPLPISLEKTNQKITLSTVLNTISTPNTPPPLNLPVFTAPAKKPSSSLASKMKMISNNSSPTSTLTLSNPILLNPSPNFIPTTQTKLKLKNPFALLWSRISPSSLNITKLNPDSHNMVPSKNFPCLPLSTQCTKKPLSLTPILMSSKDGKQSGSPGVNVNV